MRFFRQNRLGILLFVFVSLSCGVLIIKNCRSGDFFEASFVDILTIILGSLIIVFLTESLTDTRRRNDAIEHTIEEIEIFIENDENFDFQNDSALSRQMSCGNKIKYLNDASLFEIQNDVEFIQEHYDSIRKEFSNSMLVSEQRPLAAARIEQNRRLIQDRCCRIRLELYIDLKEKQ